MDAVESLTVELLTWIGATERPYAEVQEVWRTTCPRLPVWEDAKDAGLLAVRVDDVRGTVVSVSERGRDFLLERGAPAGTPASASQRRAD